MHRRVRALSIGEREIWIHTEYQEPATWKSMEARKWGRWPEGHVSWRPGEAWPTMAKGQKEGLCQAVPGL